jgi:hypothetical protein
MTKERSTAGNSRLALWRVMLRQAQHTAWLIENSTSHQSRQAGWLFIPMAIGTKIRQVVERYSQVKEATTAQQINTRNTDNSARHFLADINE